MNVFFLDQKPFDAASWHVDAHVGRMCYESAQLLINVHKRLVTVGITRHIYGDSHINHGCVDWLLQSRRNYLWLCDLLRELGSRNYRHESALLEPHLRQRTPNKLPDIPMTPPYLAVSPRLRGKRRYADTLGEAVSIYREYYKVEKKHLHSWTRNNLKPYWLH